MAVLGAGSAGAERATVVARAARIPARGSRLAAAPGSGARSPQPERVLEMGHDQGHHPAPPVIYWAGSPACEQPRGCFRGFPGHAGARHESPAYRQLRHLGQARDIVGVRFAFTRPSSRRPASTRSRSSGSTRRWPGTPPAPSRRRSGPVGPSAILSTTNSRNAASSNIGAVRAVSMKVGQIVLTRMPDGPSSHASALRHALDRVLAGAVERAARAADMAHLRRDVDDRCPAGPPPARLRATSRVT